MPISEAPSGRSPGSRRIATPVKPTATPTTLERAISSPVALRSRITISGTAAINSAARADGTSTSATVTTALAPHSSVPTRSAPRSCARVGRIAAAPRKAATRTSMTTPASAKRTPAPSSGGTVSTMIRIAKYVEPQTT